VISRRRFARIATCGLFTARLLSTTPLFAEEAPPVSAAARRSAAQSYDRGVTQFDRGEYGAAAQSFLEADARAPSVDALRNALVAARKAKQAALVREAAERALAREKVAPELASEAREALAEAETWQAASAAAPAPATPAPSSENNAEPPGAPAAPVALSRAPGATADRARPSDAWARPVFFGGVAATAVLTGLVVWSGIDTLNKKNELPGTQHDNDEVHARAHRTDALLASALVVGAATAYVGIVWVDWRRSTTAAVNVTPGGATLLVRGRF